jgi:transcriptional regulator with XRE-family HTH domain
MSIGENIKHIRQQRGVKQQEIADLVGMHRSNYSKIENGQRELSDHCFKQSGPIF